MAKITRVRVEVVLGIEGQNTDYLPAVEMNTRQVVRFIHTWDSDFSTREIALVISQSIQYERTLSLAIRYNRGLEEDRRIKRIEFNLRARKIEAHDDLPFARQLARQIMRDNQ